MRESTLETLAPLIATLRGYAMLDEVRPLSFYLNGSDLIHFHDGPEGLYADVYMTPMEGNQHSWDDPKNGIA